MAGPVLDTLTAREFQREALGRISSEQLSHIVADLERKSSALRELLLPGASRLGAAGLREVLRWSFMTRRRADAIIDAVGVDRLASAIDRLLEPTPDVSGRFDAFVAVLGDRPGRQFDLPAELLHFTDPDRYWLWSTWLWDPAGATGALRLVVTDDVDLGVGPSLGEVYLSVGRATAFVAETGRAAGLTVAGHGLFATDAFLAAVYGIYMSTVLRARLSKEFTSVLPDLPELIRRLLGVYHLEA